VDHEWRGPFSRETGDGGGIYYYIQDIIVLPRVSGERDRTVFVSGLRMPRDVSDPLGRIYREERRLRARILKGAAHLLKDRYRRQTAVYILGEIGKIDSRKVVGYLSRTLFDEEGMIRNGLVGALKRMGEVNPGKRVCSCAGTDKL